MKIYSAMYSTLNKDLFMFLRVNYLTFDSQVSVEIQNRVDSCVTLVHTVTSVRPEYGNKSKLFLMVIHPIKRLHIVFPTLNTRLLLIG